jgi:GNAT superfamily N-acetyltransferase
LPSHNYGYACLRCDATWSPDADRARLSPHPWAPPPYSADPGAAWEVVEHLRAAGWGFVLALAEPGRPLELEVVAGPTIRGVGPVLAVFHRGARRGAARCGILGHVYTRPEHRRKGAYAHLMTVQMEHTRRLGYRLLTLGTGFETLPYWIYHRCGFRSIDGASGRMTWHAAPEAEGEWFRPGATRVRPMRWDDWAPLNLLAYQPATPDEELPRSMVFRLTGQGSLEGSFLRVRLPLPAYRSPYTVEELRQGLEAVRLAALTLESEHGAAVGWAVLRPDDLALGAGWLLDCYVHPAFRGAAGQLLAAVPWPAGQRVAAYSSPPEGYRGAALRRAGFRQVAELPRWLERPPGAGPLPPGGGAEALRVFVRPPV